VTGLTDKNSSAPINRIISHRSAVLIVGTFLSPNGLGGRSVCEDLAEQLTSAGWDVTTTSSESQRLWRLMDMLRTAWAHRRRYEIAQVDVYSGRAFVWAETVCAVLRRARKPYVLTLHSGNLPLFARQWTRRMITLLRSAAVVTAPSPYLLQQMTQYRADIRLLPNAIDIGAYSFRLRRAVQPRLMWLRQFSFPEVYNPLLALNVVKMLVGEHPDIRLTMVGTDNGEGEVDRFQEFLSKEGLAGHITLPGGVSKPHVPHWLNKGDIFLNTTNTDNTPVSVVEAMASGLCIVSTNVGGIPYLLQHEHDALVVPPNDASAMAQAVHRLLTEEGLAERLSLNARRKAEQLDWSVVLPKWTSLLTAVVRSTIYQDIHTASGIERQRL
jgi:glycosyltransferase involved in cell wall biosynthesis